jgi:probable HAF family extracellular repeat protein
MVDLGTFGGTFSTAYGVNNQGQVIGYANVADDAAAHGFVWQNNVMTDLGTLGGANSYPSAINNAGQIVGSSDTANDGGHAFLWQSGNLLDLNALVAGSGWLLLDAQFITDSGRIVGNGIYNGAAQTYILDLGSNNHTPVAATGADQVVECGTSITLDGSASSDADNDALSFQWGWNGYLIGTNAVISASLPLGTNTVTLYVSDPCGTFSQTNVTIIVRDTTAPAIIGAPESVTVSVGAACTGLVPNLLAGLQLGDTCSASNELTVSQSIAAGSTLAKGSYPVTITAADASGNQASVITVVNLVDTTAPIIQSVSATPNVFTSVNKKMMPVAVAVSATDNCDATLVSQIVSITANETVAAGDIQITGVLSASLAADRNPAGNGRIYTITVRTSDSSGNSSLGTVTVSVPKGNGKK